MFSKRRTFLSVGPVMSSDNLVARIVTSQKKTTRRKILFRESMSLFAVILGSAIVASLDCFVAKAGL